jgi:hypothetical protein
MSWPVFVCLRPPPFPGVAILEVLNLDRYKVSNSCRIWSPTGLNTPSQPICILFFDTGKGERGGGELNKREG